MISVPVGGVHARSVLEIGRKHQIPERRQYHTHPIINAITAQQSMTEQNGNNFLFLELLCDFHSQIHSNFPLLLILNQILWHQRFALGHKKQRLLPQILNIFLGMGIGWLVRQIFLFLAGVEDGDLVAAGTAVGQEPGGEGTALVEVAHVGFGEVQIEVEQVGG